MMQLYIPEIGDHIRLMRDWTFSLYDESRNDGLQTLVDFETQPSVIEQKTNREKYYAILRDLQDSYRRNTIWSAEDTEKYHKYRELADVPIFCPVTLPESTVLSVDRIYIRKGASEYSSISFYLKSHPHISLKKKPRFWAKLDDCNNIMFEKTTSTLK